MVSAFKIIGIVGRIQNIKVKETLQALIQYLHDLHQTILIDQETASVLENIKDLNLSSISIPSYELSKRCDLLIVVGGDGSLLNATHTTLCGTTPVIGINRGRLGFLTDILPTEFKKIKMILD